MLMMWQNLNYLFNECLGFLDFHGGVTLKALEDLKLL